MVIADVSGKGVPASLTMAAVRAALRAQVDNVYYLYEVVRRINLMLCRDSSPANSSRCFTACWTAGTGGSPIATPAIRRRLILREGKIIELNSDNMVLGVDPEEKYMQSLVDLRVGDTLLLYTDGLTDAMNFQKERFGKQRIIEAFKTGGADAPKRCRRRYLVVAATIRRPGQADG